MTTATDMLAKYLAAEAAVLEGKEVSLGDRKLRMEDLSSITAGRKDWERRVQQEDATAANAPTIGGLTYSLASFRGRH
ncbi:hypothetical protein [Janthinobacterium sp. RB2R34]|uniref:hypothetical protein n=1 Tax=Janthinobacterium sp. RB2R34 TaxID=3424193 RepID=UPI003F1F2A13